MTRRRASVRRDNLERLIQEIGSATRLARLAGTSDSYLSQVRRSRMTANGTPRSIGDRLAAKLERAMGKRDGWLDEPQGLPGDVPAGSHPAFAKAPLVQVKTRPAWTSSMYPLISWVQAGSWMENGGALGSDDAESAFPCPVHCSRKTFVLRIQGRSMEPRFRDGDLIFVDPRAPAGNGKYVVVRFEDSNEAVIKQLVVEDGRRYLQAANPDWPDPVVDGAARFALYGVVVFKGNVI